jgi:hypothetical protein
LLNILQNVPTDPTQSSKRRMAVLPRLPQVLLFYKVFIFFCFLSTG